MAERRPSIGNPAPFAARMIAEGINATEGLRRLNEAGAGVETQRWYRVYGEMQAAIQARPELAHLDFQRLPGAEQFVPWETKAPGYAYQITHAVYDPELQVTSQRQWTVTSSTPITPAQAIAQAADEFREGQTDFAYSPVVLLGSTVTGLYQMSGDL